jgi:diacylglycerol kinase family enzyme
MQLIVAHNPTAGDGSWDANRVERLLRGAGHEPRFVSTKKKDWRTALRGEPDAFVAAGGDGTVHKVVHALEGRDVPIAILPLGTANNVAYAFGYDATDDPAARVAGWPVNEKIFHLARAEKDGQRQTFLESVGIGAFADMVSNSRSGGKKSSPAVALLAIRQALVKRLLEAKPVAITARFDGETVSGEYLMFECLNLPWYGPRLRLAPQQSPDSRTVTLCAVPVHARETAAQWISTGEGDPSRFVLGRGTCVELSADESAHVDGERWPDKDKRGGRLQIVAAVQRARIWV